MWYLVITTTIGTLDLGRLGLFYRTKSKADEMADLARGLPDTVMVDVKKR